MSYRLPTFREYAAEWLLSSAVWPVTVVGFGNLTGGSHLNAGTGNRGLSPVVLFEKKMG